MAFLKITSNSKTNAVDMFTLGVSTARGNESKIGQFGSGSLMSTLLWLRRFGESPVFMLNGARVEFTSRPERTSTGGVFHRVYQTVNGVETPLSVCLEYGEIDWTEYSMALREWICNALDQGADLAECISCVQSIDVDDTESVSVYVPMNADVRKYWQTIDQYFLHFTGRENEVALLKTEPSVCRLYRKGVFVRELPMQSICDYNLPIEINECRTGSSDSMEYTVKRCLHGEMGEPGEAYFEHVFQHILLRTECWERRSGSSWLYGGWRDYLKGQAVRLLRENAKENEEGIRIDSTWYSGFIALNKSLAGYGDTFAEENDIVPTPADRALNALADKCWNFLSMLLPESCNDRTKPDVFSFKTSRGQMPSYLGRYDKELNRVFIWHDQRSSMQTVLEEMAHAVSGKEDRSRAFQEYLLRCLAECMAIIS